jgi:hypothetical protein
MTKQSFAIRTQAFFTVFAYSTHAQQLDDSCRDKAAALQVITNVKWERKGGSHHSLKLAWNNSFA